MKVDVDFQGEIAVFTPEGPRIVWDNVENLHHAFQSAKERSPQAVILNLEKVNLVDSVGLGSFISVKQVFGKSTRVMLCALSRHVESTFQRAQLDLIFPIHADLDAAIRDLSIP